MRGSTICAAIRRAMLLAALGLALQWPHGAAQAQEMYALKLSIAIRGFDAVSYFTDGEAVKGRTEISSRYGYQNWHFATADHKRMFEADPTRYLPQYGGLSAGEMAAGRQQPANPANWVILDGKLYMVSGGTKDLEDWQRNAEANIKAADAYWAELLTKICARPFAMADERCGEGNQIP